MSSRLALLRSMMSSSSGIGSSLRLAMPLPLSSIRSSSSSCCWRLGMLRSFNSSAAAAAPPPPRAGSASMSTAAGRLGGRRFNRSDGIAAIIFAIFFAADYATEGGRSEASLKGILEQNIQEGEKRVEKLKREDLEHRAPTAEFEAQRRQRS